MKVVIVLAFTIITYLTECHGIFQGGIPIPDGVGPNICGAIITQCMHRCKAREAKGNLGTQYVQMKIHFRSSETSCITSETEVNELVSANPPNSNKSVVVFNVPCCQQPPYRLPVTPTPKTTESASEENSPPTITLKDRAITPNTVSKETITTTSTLPPPTTTARKSSATKATTNLGVVQNSSPSDGVSQDPKEKKAWDDMLLLVITILCFILLLLILALMLYKIMKKRRRKKNLKNASTGSPATSTTSNGAVLTGISNEKQQEKSAMEAISKVVKDIPPPDDYYEGPEIMGSGYMTPLQREPSTDYIVLDTMTTPPKSRSSRTRGQSDKLEEVMIVGQGRSNKLRNDSTIQYIPNGHAGGYFKGDSMRNAINTGTWSATTGRPQLPERNLETSNAKRRSDSLPQNFIGQTEVEYDKVAPDLIDMANGRERGRAQTVGTTRTHSGTNSVDRKNLNVYNLLREEKKNQGGGDVYDLLRDEKKGQESDYQRLNRVDARTNGSFSEDRKLSLPIHPESFDEKDEIESEQNTQESEYQRLNIGETTTTDIYNRIDNLTESPFKSRSESLEDDYVKEFEILKKQSLPNGGEQITHSATNDLQNNNSEDDNAGLTSYENTGKGRVRIPSDYTNSHNNPTLSIKIKENKQSDYLDRVQQGVIPVLESEDL